MKKRKINLVLEAYRTLQDLFDPAYEANLSRKIYSAGSHWPLNYFDIKRGRRVFN